MHEHIYAHFSLKRDAGAVLLEESRTVLSLIDHGVSQTRQAADWDGHGCGS
jgi:hypothetical protein